MLRLASYSVETSFFFFSAAYLRHAFAACLASLFQAAITFRVAPEVSRVTLVFCMGIKVDTKSFLFDTPAHHLIVARRRDFGLHQNTDSLLFPVYPMSKVFYLHKLFPSFRVPFARRVDLLLFLGGKLGVSRNLVS